MIGILLALLVLVAIVAVLRELGAPQWLLVVAIGLVVLWWLGALR